MQTISVTEEQILEKIRVLPQEAIPNLFHLLESISDTYSSPQKKPMLNESGLCGIWNDERSADEIIKEIYSSRTGFGGRVVHL